MFTQRLGFLFCFFIISTSVFSQSWTITDSKSIAKKGARYINPDKFISAEVDDNEIKNILWSAPNEERFDPSKDEHTIIDIMMADGTIEPFSIVRHQIMEPSLAAKYDGIRTFHGLSTSDASRRIRISYTNYGLRAMITDPSGQTYIDHLQRNDKINKIIYRRNDFSANEDWTCNFTGEKHEEHLHKDNHDESRSGDCLFRSYRLSVTATGEYSNYHDANSSADSDLVMSAIVVTVDRVNDVFEQDITTRFILIDNVDDIFYYNPNTDPFTGNNAGAMINQNQTNTDAVIGSANYDIGHIFSTGGSGLAGLGVICSNGNKARGVTGIGTPEGDPFDIDYVSHEIGHQFGANHTQNNGTECNVNNSTSMEPGSASTIMGYAGICAPNVQNNSDAYFHAISVQEMNNEITSNNCHGTISLSNSPPETTSLTDKSIPHSTPFVLDVTATDPDGDVLTYNWEQMDNEVGPTMPPVGTNAQGPLFRSNFALTDSKRYFPDLANLTNNTTSTWEAIPTVDRDMDFRVTVRDNTFAPGCTDEQDISLEVDGNSGPFIVTSQNSATTWLETENVNISWDVANTDVAPVSCANVDILLSYDGGFTYPVTLASAVPNNGLANLNIPNGTTTQGRVMVKCSDNVFFDINDTNITIDPGSPTFSLTTDPVEVTVCDNQSTTFVINTASILGYSNAINLSLSNVPNGASSSMSSTSITPGNSSTVTIDDLENITGSFSLLITGSSGSIVKEATFILNVESSEDAPTLISPEDAFSGAPIEPTLSWASNPNAVSYEYQVSTSPNGGNVISTGMTTETSVIITPSLELSTQYYWKVRIISLCGTTEWSTDRTFTTGLCFIASANDLPINISASGTPTITSTLSITEQGVITDMNVVNLFGTHTYITDLTFTLIGPDGTELVIFEKPCGSQNNFDINFDDEAANSNFPCPPIDGLTYQPENPLSTFDTKEVEGEWTLEVFDDFNADGGQLQSWGLEVCIDQTCDLTVNNNAFDNTFGTLSSALDCAIDGDTIYLDAAIANNTINTGSGSIIIDHSIVIIANPSDDINIISEGNVPTFIINSGKTVTFEGFSIDNIDSDNGVIQNDGNLTMRDMIVTSSNENNSVENQSNGILTIEGNCQLRAE